MLGKTIFVVGGAGYIGSHTAKALARAGSRVVVIDNLSRGFEKALKWGEFLQLDLADSEGLDEAFKRYQPDAVMHFAAYAYVGESVENPGLYYKNNVANTLNLLSAMIRGNCRAFIFSSTCATYGEPQKLPLTEDHPQSPVNPYGWTKYMVERMEEDFERAHGLKFVNLRYFNASGADPETEIGENHDPETHLIPLAIQAALGQREGITVFGTDYPTPDSTCVRDYIHVTDLAEAHLLALDHLLKGGGSRSYNLGNGEGFSVKEVLDTVEKVSGRKLNITYGPRRPGDPAVLVGSSALIHGELGWTPHFTGLYEIIETAWKWHLRSGS